MNPHDPTTGAVVAPAPRRLFRLPKALQAREFRRFWVGETVSLFGDQATQIALPLVGVLALHASAAQMGYLGAALLFPNLLFSLHAGAWVDRRGRRREMMIFTALGRAAALATIPIAYAFGALTLTQLYIASFLIGTLSVLFYVSYTTLFVSLVPRERYLEAGADCIFVPGLRNPEHIKTVIDHLSADLRTANLPANDLRSGVSPT